MMEAEAGKHGANKAGFAASGNRLCHEEPGGKVATVSGLIPAGGSGRFHHLSVRRRMIAITIRNLRKSFGESVALQSINLEIQPGELFFLLGPSGCGKTTLLRHIAGFYEPDSGQILFDGDDVTRVPAHKRDTAMMFQSYALWPHLNVARNVSFGLEERKVAPAEIEERVMEALRIVRMQEYAERRINQLSGGQQQRIALARALVVRPRCLLLDEPLSNLDAKLRLEMRSEIRRICKEFGFTAVYVTHDQKEALSIADRMAVLDGGVIAQVGTPEQIYRRPHTATVSAFIGETNFLTGHVDYVSGETVLITGHNGDIEGRISDPSWKPARGEQVKLSIRPEALTLRDDPATKNCLTVRILSCTYLGETAQYELQTRHGEMLRVSELNPGSLREPGDRFRYAHAEPKDVVVLRG
jgi:ABC-type Fe3+/spermidine/putrescine transport system ATPase subunit